MSTKGSQTKERILELTWELLERDGGGVTVAGIADAAGVSRQAVYLHFGSRAGLLVATVRHHDTKTGISDRFATAAGSAESGVDAAKAWLRVWFDYLPSIVTVVQLLGAAAEVDPAARDALDDRMERQRDRLTWIFEWIERDGALNPDLEPRQAAEMLWSLVHVAAWTQLVTDCGWSEERFSKSRFDLFERSFLRSS